MLISKVHCLCATIIQQCYILDVIAKCLTKYLLEVVYKQNCTRVADVKAAALVYTEYKLLFLATKICVFL